MATARLSAPVRDIALVGALTARNSSCTQVALSAESPKFISKLVLWGCLLNKVTT